MRFSLLLLLCVWPALANAFWSGVAVQFGDYDSDWVFDDEVREAQVSEINFQIEEKFETELRAGFSLGYFDMRLVADEAETLKFDGSYLDVYLHQPVEFGESLALHGFFSYRFNSGSGSGDLDADIDWNEVTFQLGLSLRFSNYRIWPYASYKNVDGDISGTPGVDAFDQDEDLSHGIRFDYFLDPSGYVRLEFLSGGQSGGYLSFARRY